MLRLTLVNFFIFLSSSTAYAGSCANEISPKGNSSDRIGQATCPDCQKVSEFAKVGAALLQKNRELTNRQRQRPRYDFLHVTNGDNLVEVSVATLTFNSGINIGFEPISF